MPSLPLYSGDPADFRWVGFGSGSGTNLREAATVITPALIFSDRPTANLLALEELADVPKEVLNGFEFCGSWKRAKGNHAAEELYHRRSAEYNCRILELLREQEAAQGKPFNLIVLGGYMRLLQEPLLSAYANRIINVHPADLTVLQGSARRYVGPAAVGDALAAGERRTRSSIILVNDQVDGGPILVSGPWVEYTEGEFTPNVAENKQKAAGHQAKQKEQSDWPAIRFAIQSIAKGKFALSTDQVHPEGNPVVLYEETELPYGGYTMEGRP